MRRPERPIAATDTTERQRGWVRRGVAVLALGLLAPLIGGSPAGAASLPGGKANYVVSVIGGPVNAVAVRLATYQFHRDGRVTERFWSWRQDAMSGKDNAYWAKPSSGYTTAGCLHACPIRTPVGFQRGRQGSQHTGTWSMDDSGVLAIRWSLGSLERWTLDTSAPGMVGARLVTDGAARGWAIGSNAALSQAVDMRAIYGSERLYGPLAQNAYGRATDYLHIGFHAPDYSLCPSGLCMQGVGVTAADKASWFSSYFAANPATDGRKVFWNNQTGAVQQFEQPGSNCISARGGGHTDALLQALDDSGRFVGLVGVEASLNQRKTGQAVVSAFAMVLPSVLSTVG
jgi:hypothetical protein